MIMETLLSPEEAAAITTAMTNNFDLLPDSLQTTVHLLLTDAERSVAQLDDKIARIQAILDDLNIQRSGYITRMQQYATAIAPHRKLPVDMLGEIFTRCNLEPVAVPFELMGMPWILGRVCSKWRQVTLSSPMLWSDIQVEMFAYESSRTISMLEVVLSRSASAPVSISFTVDNETDEDSELDKLLISCASRVRYLHFRGLLSCIKSFLSLPPGSVECLRSLEVLGSQFPNAQDVFSVVRGARNLREVTLHLVDGRLPAVSFHNIPFHQLTRLSIDMENPLPTALAFDLFTQCTSLVDCSLEITTETSEGPRHVSGQRTVVTLEHLKKLQLWTSGAVDNIQWFEHLSLPNLIHLYYRHLDADSAWPSAWTSGICRSARLERLDIHIPISTADLEEILAAMPVLCAMEIPQGLTISETLLARMSCGNLVPRLSYFRCEIDTESALQAHLDMLENRRYGENSAADIPTVIFCLPDFSDWGVVHRVNQLVKEGWDIELRRCW